MSKKTISYFTYVRANYYVTGLVHAKCEQLEANLALNFFTLSFPFSTQVAGCQDLL